MECNELKFLLKLLDCRDYRSPLSAAAFRNFKGKDKICQDLGKDGLVGFSTEIDTVKIAPPGSALLKIATQLPISAKELKVLHYIATAGKISKSKITVSSVKAAERDKILQSFRERGLVEVETKLKRTKAEVWLTQRGHECLDLVNDYFQQERKLPGWASPPPLATEKLANPPGSQPSEQQILQTIQDLDRQLGTENYLPIFYLRQILQPPLSREQLDQALYRLQRNDQIELSSLQEVTAYTKEQIDAGISQDIGGALFFIVVN
jgi:DNA-binding MarR family transcriptional regulator